jgi:RNA polymerase sigma factor (sigma-70 family)
MSAEPIRRGKDGMDVVSFLEMSHQSHAADDSGRRFLRYAKEGDVGELDSLLADHLDRAFCQAKRLLGNASEAEDAVQDAFLRLVHSAHRYDGSVPFAGWLASMVHWSALNVWRSRRRRLRRDRQACSQQPSREEREAFSSTEQNEVVRAAVLELPERYRRPIDLHYFAGLSQREIGLALGMQEDAVAKRLQRARECLRSLLQRRGVTVTGALVLLALHSAPADAAPVTLSAKVLAATHASSTASAVSTNLAVSSVSYFSGKMLAIVVASSVMAGGAWWSLVATANDTSASTSTPELQSFTFDRADEQQAFSVLTGSWTWLQDMGYERPGCMETDGGLFLLELPVDRRDLPLQVTFRTNIQGTTNGHSCGVHFNESSWRAIFHNVGTVVYVDPDGNQWSEHKFYVTEQYVYFSADGKLTNYFFHQVDSETEKIHLKITNRIRVDNLEIRRISADKLPNVDRFVGALNRIAETDRHGTVVVPELTSAEPGKDVTIEFQGSRR